MGLFRRMDRALDGIEYSAKASAKLNASSSILQVLLQHPTETGSPLYKDMNTLANVLADEGRELGKKGGAF